MKNQPILFVLICSITLMVAASEPLYNAVYASDYHVALIVSKKSPALQEPDKLNLHIRGYAAETDKSTVSDQKSAGDYLKLGIAHDEAGEFNKAIEAYRKAIVARPEYPEAHYHIALSYLKSHDSIAAHDEYKTLKHISPEMAMDLYDKAFAIASSDNDSVYVMQVGAYRNAEYAHEMIEKLREEYLNAYIEYGEKFNRVRILGLKTREEANVIMKELTSKFKVDPFVLLNR